MRYDPDRRGIGDYLKFDPELKVELARRAELGLAVARALAPVLKHPQRDRVPGELKGSGHVEDDGVGGFHHDRMQLSVVFDPFQGYGAAATFPHRRHPDPTARDYLLAAIPMIERG